MNRNQFSTQRRLRVFRRLTYDFFVKKIYDKIANEYDFRYFRQRMRHNSTLERSI